MTADSDRPPTPYIALTGMVGVGKTTLAQALAENLGWGLMSETVEQEQNPWLERFYQAHQEPNPYALPLQLYFLLDRIKQLRYHTQQGQPFIADQALEVDLGVFVRGHLEEGVMTEDEFQLLQETYQQLKTHQQVPTPDLLIHLQAPLELVLERIRSRGRTSEQKVDLDYWERLYQRFQPPIRGCQGLRQIQLDIRDYDAHDHTDVEHVTEQISRALPYSLPHQ